MYQVMDFFTFEQTEIIIIVILKIQADLRKYVTVKLFGTFRSINSNSRYYDRGRLLRVGYRTTEITNLSGVIIRKFILRINWNSYFPNDKYTGDGNEIVPKAHGRVESTFF